mgnify:CR=1 FL=1
MATQSLFHKKKDNTKLIKVFPESLPNKTNLWCWWCCHPFDNIPVALPIHYDSTKDMFELTGVFCCFSCCKSYSIYSPNNSTVFTSNIKLLAIKMGIPARQCIIPAPPRQTLKVFGGYLSIDEFRNKTKQFVAVKLLTSNQLISNQIVDEEHIQSKCTIVPHTQEQTETFALKRTKPLKKQKGTLEFAMGLTVK